VHSVLREWKYEIRQKEKVRDFGREGRKKNEKKRRVPGWTIGDLFVLRRVCRFIGCCFFLGAEVVDWLCWLRVPVGLVRYWVDGEAILLSRLARKKLQNHSCKHKLGYTKGGYLYAKVRVLLSSRKISLELCHADCPSSPARCPLLSACSMQSCPSVTCLPAAGKALACKQGFLAVPTSLLAGVQRRSLEMPAPCGTTPIINQELLSQSSAERFCPGTFDANPTWPHSLLSPRHILIFFEVTFSVPFRSQRIPFATCIWSGIGRQWPTLQLRRAHDLYLALQELNFLGPVPGM
jgi:hypothetical protein